MKGKSELSVNIERYNPTIDVGLTSEQIDERIKNKLVNTTQQKYSKSYLNILTNNVCTFFNLLGLIVLIALLCVGANLMDFVFVVVYLANITIGITQEIRAKRCIEKLSLVAKDNVKVIRNGKETEISTKDIVLDDIIKLGIGSQIPTDCEIVSGYVEVNESLLTGESVPVKKRENDQLFAGSFIVSGVCYAKAVKVGKDNYVEQLSAKAKKYKKPHSEIMNSLKLIITTVGFIIIPIAAAYMLKSAVFLDVEIDESIRRTSTVVIGMIPSGMFLLTSLALAVGIIKLARHNTLVQDLYSLEMLARVDTICFDKTGTITDGKMSVKEVVSLNKSPYPVNQIFSSILGTLQDNNQTAIALHNYFGQEVTLKAIKSLPFNSTRKLSAVSFENAGTYAFGAPEFVLSEDAFSKIENKINEYSSMGLRVLALAHSNGELDGENVPKDFEPIALVLIVDNVREDAITTIQWFKDNGVAIKVISGDNPITVSEVSKRVGIDNADNYVSLEGLSDEQVFDAATKYTVFGRVTPDQKAILIKALKAAGHTTAMTGDGVNDIIALKEADCAISVAAGSEAARNVAHLVLMDNNFNSMPKIVYEGRRVINNVQSSASLYLMKTLFVMLLSIVTLCLPYIKVYPFSLKQMNVLELLIIGLASFLLSIQPNNERVEGKFISFVLGKALPSAILMFISVAIVEVFKLTIGGLFPNITEETYTTMGVFALTYAGLISLYNICKPFNKYRTALFLLVLSILLAISAIVVFRGLPFLGLTTFAPLVNYWQHILISVSIILLDIPLYGYLQKACSYVKFDKFGKKPKQK